MRQTKKKISLFEDDEIFGQPADKAIPDKKETKAIPEKKATQAPQVLKV